MEENGSIHVTRIKGDERFYAYGPPEGEVRRI
jgi:hypothetical protein